MCGLTNQSLALYVISVRRARGLLTASFRLHLTMDTLAVRLYTSLLPRRIRDFHPLERAHGAQTQKRTEGTASVLDLQMHLNPHAHASYISGTTLYELVCFFFILSQSC